MRRLLKPLCLFICSLFILPTLSSCKKKSQTSSYDLYVEYSSGKIDGKLVYKFINSQNLQFDHVIFNLHANAYKEGAKNRPVTPTTEQRAYPDGVTYGNIDVKTVTVDGKNASFEIYGSDDAFLKVFTKPLKKGDSANIQIEFCTTIPKSHLRLGETELGVNLADFFPSACKIEDGKFKEIEYSPLGDPYYFDVHDFSAHVTVPSEYAVACSGFPTQTAIDGTKTTYSFALENGRDFAISLSKNFDIASKTHNGIVYSYYGFSQDGEEMLDLMIESVEFFAKTFGAYPYKSLSIAECPFVFGGMEFSGLCFLNSSLQGQTKIQSAVHEIAHQWWHCAVECDQSTCAYIDEGLAEYSTYLYLAKCKGETLANQMVSDAKSAYKSFFSIEETLSGTVNSTMERPLSSFKNEYEYVNLAYNKSLIMFYEYGLAIGQDKAIKNLAKLYQKYKFSSIGYLETVEILGYEEHFNSFVEGKVLI